MADEKNRSNNSDKLATMLAFDAAKSPTLTQALFGEVVKEIQEERAKDAKSKAKEQLVKAMQIREQMVKASKEFGNQQQRMEKELGKVLNQIQGVLSGRYHEEHQDCDKEDNKEECCE